ncbi:hypothetical protein J6TS2_50660 [Heyndrickxia sporothermodurans]|nr:hypothetical protein J6TS2_50660 [Heyndrickxia sporothermodurans]
MNQLQIFKNDFFQVAAKMENDQILFDVEQVAKSLGITQEKNNKEYIRWERVNEYLPKNSPQVGKGDLIPEPLVYKLAFKASNEVAEQFQDWLAIEVIPSIRKTGSYSLQVPQTFAQALRLAADLQEKIELDRPKVEAHDKFISGENLQKMAHVAKVLGWGRNKLFAFLREKKILMSDNTPYQQYIDRGYFEVKESPIKMGGQTINKPQTYVTAKGVDFLSRFTNEKTA